MLTRTRRVARDIARVELALEQQTKTEAPAAWPEGVIARYVTVGGATVDLTHVALREDANATQASCTGCQESQRSSWTDQYRSHGTSTYVAYQNQSMGDRDARKWAQVHADVCRALPMPATA